MFNLYRQLRNAACVVLFIATYTGTVSLVVLGFIMLMTSLVGGMDLAERRIDLLEKIVLTEKKEKTNEETDAR